MTRSEKLVASLVSQMDVESLRDLAALALRGVDAVALLNETAEERTRRLDRERKKRTRAGQPAGQTQDTDRTLAGRSMDTNRTLAGHVSAVEGVGGGLSLGISSDLFSGSPEENTKNPPKPPRRSARRASECDAPVSVLVVDDAMQAQAIKNGWPDPFAAYESLTDNYLAKGKRAVGVEGWKAALRGWLKRNLDGQPPWDPQLAARRRQRELSEAASAPARDMVRVDPEEIEAQLAALTATLILPEAS